MFWRYDIDKINVEDWKHLEAFWLSGQGKAYAFSSRMEDESGPLELPVDPIYRKIGDLIVEVEERIDADGRWKPVRNDLIRAGAGAQEIEKE